MLPTILSECDTSPSITHSFLGLQRAFARGNMLTDDDRIEASWLFNSVMSFRKACRIMVKYALGFYDEDKVSLRRIVHAWVVLGEDLWGRIVGFIQQMKELWLDAKRLLKVIVEKTYPDRLLLVR